jgi:glycosyltransferase involved in cell wall biosynthesis
MDKYYRAVKMHADLVTTYSQHTRDDVIRTLGIPAEKVVSVPLGCDVEFRPVRPDSAATQLDKLGLRFGRYLLTVGTIEPRKNHISLFRAYEKLKARGLTAGLPLVVIGTKGWGCEPIFAEIDRLGLGNDVRMMGFVESLPALYSGAAAMAYPSFYEGFGLPPLEAMACGCPVITSNSTSLPEVVGSAGMMVAPEDVDGLADCLQKVLTDEECRAGMIEAGIRRAAEFTWKKYAEGMFDSYREALKRIRPVQ